MGKFNDPITGQFIKGGRPAALENRNHAQMIYNALKKLATPEWVTKQVEELCAEGGHVQRATLEMVLDRVAPAVKQVAVSGDGGQLMFNVSTLTPDEQHQLTMIALKTLTAPPIDAEFEVMAPKQIEEN